jgi:hypothetical protein
MIVTTPFLLDGPLMTAVERRKAVTERMAKDLIEAGALGSDQDAIRLLHAAGYPMLDVALLAAEARMLAYQEIVAREMSAP